jgi:hypothetical protein
MPGHFDVFAVPALIISSITMPCLLTLFHFIISFDFAFYSCRQMRAMPLFS